jgi:glycosyltransferase involved in cell wall biosynthesis
MNVPSPLQIGLPTVDLVIPVLNEAHVLERSIVTVRDFLGAELTGCAWRIIVVDNGSVDGTDTVGEALASRFDDVLYVRLTQRGRGRALRYAWMQSRADVCAYMDVDLSTDLAYFPKLVGAIIHDGYDLATGSRLMRESRIKRAPKRDIISRIYNLMVKLVFFTRFSDAQCGFKAVSRRIIDEVVPLVEDESWFFDTELLVLSEKRGYRIKDVPIVWIDDDDSRVKIVRTAWEDIKGLARVRWALWMGAFGTPRVRGAERDGET